MLLSVFDGSFGVIQATNLRSDPSFAGIDGRGIGIAVIDTGVFAQNPDLQPNFVHWYDAVTRTDSSYTNRSAMLQAAFDPNGHGSHVAGIAAARNSDLGVAPMAGIIGIRGLLQPGESYPNHDVLADALQWVIDHHNQFNIKVVNMSLGTTTNINTPQARTSGSAALIAQLEQLNITVVAASGNDYATFVAAGASTPAVYSTISVANTWAENQNFGGTMYSWAHEDSRFGTAEREARIDRLAAGSQRSSLANQIAAPGEDILSTWNGAGASAHNQISGTSMAAPMVSGAVALMQQAAFTYTGDYLSTSEVVSILKGSGDTIVDSDVASNGRVPIRNGQVVTSQETGLPETGLTLKRLNVYRAVQFVRDLFASTPGDSNAEGGAATDLGRIDGTRTLTFAGNVGRDGQTSIGTNDVDVYRITTASPGTLSLRLDPVAGGTGFDSYLRLFDGNGSPIKANDDISSTNRYSALTSDTVLSAGVYYIGVTSFNNTGYSIVTGAGRQNGESQGDYQLSISLSNPDPNGVFQGAVPFGGLPNSFVGDINSDPPLPGTSTRVAIGPQDVDMFAIIAPDDGALIVDTDTSAYGNQKVDTFVRAFNAQGAILRDAQGNPIVNDDADANTTDSHLPIAVTRGQTLYVAVSDYWNQSYDPSNPYNRSTQGTGGSYDLFFTFDNGDQNGTVATALARTIGQSFLSNVGTDPLPAGGRITVGRDGTKDVDFVTYVPAAAGLLDIAAVGENGFTPALSLWTFDAVQNDVIKLGESQQTDSRLIARVQANVTYYVAVTGLGNNDFLWFAPGSGAGGQTGQCSVTATLRPDSDFAQLSNNQIAAGLTDLTLGVTIAGDVGMDGSLIVGPGDVDMFRFVAPANGVVVLATDTSAEHSSDTFLRVFNSNGAELAFNDDDGAGTTDSRLQMTVEAGHTYYVGVNGASAGARNYNPLTGAGAVAGSQGNYLLYASMLPTSRVAALPATSPRLFTLRWSGTAGAGGFGIASYDIFVSTNGGPFTPFLTATTLTSTEVEGFAGQTYRFCCIATDLLGNRETTQLQAQAETRIVGSIFVTGADAGGGPDVKVYDAMTGEVQFSFFAYDSRFTGGVRVAVGDVSGDGMPDVICAAGPGGGPNISIFDGLTGQRLPSPLGSFFAYDSGFTGGVYVAAGDVNADGFADIICGADSGGGPNITVFNGKDGSRLFSFFAYNPNFTGGVRVAAGDIDGDGRADIIAGAGPGGGPNVTIFSGFDASLLGSYFAYDPGFTPGIYVAAGDVNGDGFADVITGAGAGGGPNVAVFDDVDGKALQSFFPYDVRFTGGVRVAAVDRNGDGMADVISVPGPGGGPDVRTIDALTLAQVDDFFAYDLRFSGGLYVAAGG